MLDREGYVDIKAWGATAAAMILAPEPGAEDVLLELGFKITQAEWSYRFANDASERRLGRVL